MLAISSTVPVRHEEVEAPVSAAQRPTAKIPVSQIARIRAWAKYGLTVAQIAEVCGVAAGEIERILRQDLKDATK